MHRMIAAATLMAAAAPLAAQEPACAVPLVAPAPWARWSRPAPLVAAEKPGPSRFAMLRPGRAATVTLAPDRAVVFVVTPAKPLGPIGYGGMVMLAVPVAGIYRIAIGAPAWIDMVSAGRSLASAAHDHGPACSGIVKTVDFALPAGAATIELSGASTPVTTVMVVRVS